MPQTLSSREANLFRQLIRNYEDKQYKRGLKAAEQILKKNPKHGDTMAMKALIINAQGRTEEAFALGKEALTVDMKSHICWHVYGLLYRANKNFEEAIKAYKFALKLEPESHQIQRDLAVLQVQMRDYQGYVQSRLAMLQAKPQLRQNWTGLAVAHHLAGSLQEALNILNMYEDTLKTQPPKTDLEHSEATLYKNSIIAEMGETQQALEHLEAAASHNIDRLAVMECRARYLTKLGKKEDAVKAWRELIDRNSEHADYYLSLLDTLDIAKDDAASVKGLFGEYAAKWPKCDAARRIPLDFLSGDDFESAAREYLTLMLNKGVPSTFANLKHLYTDKFKMQTLPRLAEEYLKSANVINGSSDATSHDSSKGEPAALYFLAQHYNYHASRDLDKAMKYCERALKLGPDNVDFHMTKARIWKHHGNTAKAAEAMDHARTLDTRDRYINSKAAKYQLRNRENDKALKTMGLFTRADSAAGPFSDLLDMQCVWYLTEDGLAYYSRGNVGLALKRFHAVHNIFDIWQEDQFDFHSFSLRKGLIRAYVDMVRWEDRLREHPFFTRAALSAVKIYLDLHDRRTKSVVGNGVNGTSGASGNGAGGAGNDAEAKKAAKKAKKDAQKAQRDAEEAVAKQNPNKGAKAPDPDALKKKDEDPLGLKLAATDDPLNDAMKFVTPLLQFSPRNILVHQLAFEVFLRRRKYLLAIRSLNAAKALEPDSSEVHRQAIALRAALNSQLDSLPPKTQEVIKSEFTSPASSTDLKKLNAEFRAHHKDEPGHVRAAAEADLVLGGTWSQYERETLDLLKMKKVSIEDAVAAFKTLQVSGSADLGSFKEQARSKWPEATLFAA